MIRTKRNALAAEDQPMSRIWGLSSTGAAVVDNSKWSFVTIVRHPIERLLSHYKFEQLGAKTNRTIVEWARHSPFFGQNFMVRSFAGMVPPKLPPHILENVAEIWPYFDHMPPEGWDASSVQSVTRQDLELAKKVLNRFTVVLALDWLEECAPLLKRWLAIETDDIRARYWWGSIQATPSKRRRHPHPDGDYAPLFEMNALDMELFEYARGLCRCAGQRVYWQDASQSKGQRGCLSVHRHTDQAKSDFEAKQC